MSRSIVIRMRRRAPTETIEPYRRRDEIDEGHELRGRLAGWAAAKGKILYAARPALPPGIEDRNADVWEALFAVADAAGGDWGKKAREAAIALVAAGREQEPSLGIRLLADLRTVFGKTEALFTEAILTALHALEEAPWKDLNGKGLDSRGLALRLRQYGIKSKQIRDGTTTKKGYQRADLADAWARYLPSPQTSETSETAETSPDFQGPNVSAVSDNSPDVSDEVQNVSDSPTDVSLNGGPKNPRNQRVFRMFRMFRSWRITGAGLPKPSTAAVRSVRNAVILVATKSSSVTGRRPGSIANARRRIGASSMRATLQMASLRSPPTILGPADGQAIQLRAPRG